MKTLAAVDMGSNAIRVHIANLLENKDHYEFKTLEYMRVPLRLGEDVFKFGRIGEAKVDLLLKLTQSLTYLFELYEVRQYLACATSAMREAANHAEVVARIKQQNGFDLQVIDGITEADWANKGLLKFLTNGTWVHVDVGGGSSEINIYQDKVKIASQSFRIGAVRMLMKEDVSEVKHDLEEWVRTHVPSNGAPPMAIGTGGNIGKIHELSKLKDHETIRFEQIQHMTDFIASHSLEERIHHLKLNPDRADVIVPSSEIYLSVMKAANSHEMLVPKVGLTDGMFQVMAGL